MDRHTMQLTIAGWMCKDAPCVSLHTIRASCRQWLSARLVDDKQDFVIKELLRTIAAPKVHRSDVENCLRGIHMLMTVPEVWADDEMY